MAPTFNRNQPQVSKLPCPIREPTANPESPLAWLLGLHERSGAHTGNAQDVRFYMETLG